jgi:hypothetical protein
MVTAWRAGHNGPEFDAGGLLISHKKVEVNVNALLNIKSVVGLLSSVAITGTMFFGFSHATKSQPTRWPIRYAQKPQPVEVFLFKGMGSNQQCDWIPADSVRRVARCPVIEVTAKRLAPGSSGTNPTSAEGEHLERHPVVAQSRSIPGAP